MKVIIAGSRNIVDYNTIVSAINSSQFKITCVVSGTARGVDTLGEKWAKENKVKIERYPADWDKHGRAAGYIRNEQMSKVADALIAIWDGESKGTKHMIDIMVNLGKRVHICKV